MKKYNILLLFIFYYNLSNAQKIRLPQVSVLWESKNSKDTLSNSTEISDHIQLLSLHKTEILNIYSNFWSNGYYMIDSVRVLRVYVDWWDNGGGAMGDKMFLVTYNMKWKLIDILPIAKHSDRFKTDISINGKNISFTMIEIFKPWEIKSDNTTYSLTGKGKITKQSYQINFKGKFIKISKKVKFKNKIIFDKVGWRAE